MLSKAVFYKTTKKNNNTMIKNTVSSVRFCYKLKQSRSKWKKWERLDCCWSTPWNFSMCFRVRWSWHFNDLVSVPILISWSMLSSYCLSQDFRINLTSTAGRQLMTWARIMTMNQSCITTEGRLLRMAYQQLWTSTTRLWSLARTTTSWVKKTSLK